MTVNVLQFVNIRESQEEKRERERVQAAQRGDRRAFDALAGDYTPVLRGFLARRVGAESADDVLQETLLAAWTGLAHYRRQARFKAWLFAIAARKCTDCYRRRGRALPEVPLHEAESVADAAPNAQAEIAERNRALRLAMAQLPDAQRETLELYYDGELTLPEIAVALERNLNTVKYQFYRAHTRVAQAMTAERPERRETAAKGSEIR